MKTKLYVVEGLPCSGKSTTSKVIADKLERRGKNVIWVDEGTGNHPADYEFHSYITYKELCREFSKSEQKQILNFAIPKENSYIVPLGSFNGSLFYKLLQHKIYDFLPWETEKEIILNGWRKFVQNADKNAIYVFNCCLLQNPMCEMMIRFGYDYEVIKEYLMELFEAVREMNPAIVYLSVDAVERRISDVAKDREMDWLSAVVTYHTEGVYGQKNHLQGFQGYIKALEERQKLEQKFLKESKVQFLEIKDAYHNWGASYEKLVNFLDSRT